jgi:hypothetical protein
MSQNQRKIRGKHVFMSVSKHTSETSIKFGIEEVHTKSNQENVLWFILSNAPIPKLCVLGDFKFSSEVDLTHKLHSVSDEHLIRLNHWSEKYFPEDMGKFAWIHDQFTAKTPSEFTSAEEENLTEPSCDKTLKTKSDSLEVTEFWTSVKVEYLLLSAKAQRILLPIVTSSLCKAGFWAVAVKRKQVACENQCGRGNDGGGVHGGVQSESAV